MGAVNFITPKINWLDSDYYNAEDYNRVESNTLLLSDYFISLGYIFNLNAFISDRTVDSYDLYTSINRLEDNLDAIRLGLVTPPDYQDKKVWSESIPFTYADAIRWETNLNLLNTWGLNIISAYKYSGTFSAGQEIIL